RFQIRSDGKYVRDYIYVEDIVLGYLTLAQKMKKLNLAGEAFNFSDEKPMTVLELYSKIIKRIRNKTVKPEILNYARNEIRKQYLSTRKSRTILNWRARHSLEEGLDKTIHWYRSNRVKTRN
ncbi:MAG: sugar dehydratase, partial [Candidatus Omnitrophica bacterium]|nr:sugar dehydratase [Candidatus Omnitrophota bacterium]